MYELITQEEADRIKNILNESELNDSINIEVLNSKYKLNVFNITQREKSKHHGYDMNEFYLIDNDSKHDVLEYKNKLYDIFINFGEWGYKTRLKNAHITIGSSKFHEYSFQLELSQAVKDEKYIYIIKNVSNLAGNGALVRLYRGLGKNRVKKENRVDRFIKEFNNEILECCGKEWIVISRIKLDNLFDYNKREEIFYNLLNSILKAMLLVEGIGEEE